jgi:hypothetical protein
MRISISIIALGVVSIACYNSEVNAGSFRLPNEDGVRMATHLRFASSDSEDEGRKSLYSSSSSFVTARSHIDSYSEDKTWIKLYSSSSSFVSTGSDFDTDSEDEGTETCIVNSGFSNTSSASSMSDNDSDQEEEIEEMWAGWEFLRPPSVLILTPKMTASSLVKQPFSRSVTDGSRNKGKEKEQPNIRAWKVRCVVIKEVRDVYYTQHYYPLMKLRFPPTPIPREADSSQEATSAQKTVPATKHRWLSSLAQLIKRK